MPTYRLPRAATLLGVSDDTVRRWADSGRLPTTVDDDGRRVVEGTDLAKVAVDLAGDSETPAGARAQSARNRFTGIVTRVLLGDVSAQVEIQAGPHRVVSLLTREAVEELGLAAGMPAVATVKATNVGVELPADLR